MDSFLRKIINFSLLLSLCSTALIAQNGRLKVVLDAGHGGKDIGATYHGYVEKNIALSVALKVGKILEKESGIDVVYTRKTDVFVELIERANFANRVKANLFVSIHCNGVKDNSAYGTETFVMGQTRNAMNLEIAKKENQVIELEKDYKSTYKGFDPKSPQSTLGFSVYKEEYLEHSINVAGRIEQNFKNDLKMKSRGVKQLPLWVLDATVMPGVLIELGFISNPTEGAFLNTEKGQEESAEAIAKAIIGYKKEYYGNSTNDTNSSNSKGEVVAKSAEPAQIDTPTKNVEPKVSETKNTPVKEEVKSTKSDVVFKVQISASGTKLALEPNNFKGLDDLSILQEGSLYKYLYGNANDYESAKQLLATAKSKGFTSAYIVAFKDGKRVNLQEALK